MRSGAGRITASLLAVALCLLSAGPASATDGGPAAAAVDQSDSPSVVVVAQEGGSDEDSDTGLRLIDRQSTTRVDAVVIALWSIAGGMTVMLAVFLWHTSPRRRLRLARTRSAHLVEKAEEDAAAGEAEVDEQDVESSKDVGDGEKAVVGEAEEDDEPDEDAEAGEESGDAGQSAASREAELSEVAAASREAEEAEEADEGAEDGEAEVDEDDSGQGFWPRPGDARGLD